MIKRLWRSGRLLCLALLVIGVLLRLTTLRDSVDVFAPLYYATPWPVLALLSILSTYPFLKKARNRWLLRAGLTLGCLLAWLQPMWTGNVPKPGRSDVTVLFWNLQQKPHMNEALVNVLIEERPDIAVFVERGEAFIKSLPRYRELLPDYSIEGLDNLMIVFSRGPILSRQNVDLSTRSRYNRLEVLVDGRSYVVYVVDIDPNVLLSRRAPLDAVRKAAVQETQPTLIAGDFNTPVDSARFDAYRENFEHAFEVSGKGMVETWPYFFPLLSLDHIWAKLGLEPIHTKKIARGFASDHMGLVTRMRVTGQE